VVASELRAVGPRGVEDGVRRVEDLAEELELLAEELEGQPLGLVVAGEEVEHE
jgi:hypothetical protein